MGNILQTCLEDNTDDKKMSCHYCNKILKSEELKCNTCKKRIHKKCINLYNKENKFLKNIECPNCKSKDSMLIWSYTLK